MKHKFRDYIDSHRDEMLGFLREIVEVNSFTRNPEGVDRVGRIMAGFLAELGFDEERTEMEGLGAQQVFTRPGRGKKLLFLTHKDTVFPPESGFVDFRVEGDRAFGPGVIDMKGGITVLLFAIKMLRDMGLAGDRDLTLTAVSDEEAGSEDSRAITEEAARGKDYVFVFECGGEGGELATARKGVGTFFIDVEGRSAHAGHSYSQGINANLELAHKTIAVHRLTDLERGTTLNVGEVRGGIGANTISPSARLVIDLRFEMAGEGKRIEKELAWISETSFVPGTRSVLSGVIQRPVMVETDGTREFLEIVREAAGEEIASEQRGGVSDANFTAALGVPTLDGFGPIGADDHRPSEYMVLDSLFERTALLAGVLTHPKMDAS